MNKKIDFSKMTLDQLIAHKTATAERAAKAQAIVAEELEAIRAQAGTLIDAKNVADVASNVKKTLWEHFYNAACKILNCEDVAVDEREQTFADAMEEFTAIATNPDGTKAKATTAGQYASTAGKMLAHVSLATTAETIEDFEGKSVSDVRKALKGNEDAELYTAIQEAAKRLRFIVKNGTADEKAELETVFASIVSKYNPVKARKDKASVAATADATLRDDKQQAPNEGTTVETVASELLDNDEESDNDGHGLKVAVG